MKTQESLKSTDSYWLVTETESRKFNFIHAMQAITHCEKDKLPSNYSQLMYQLTEKKVEDKQTNFFRAAMEKYSNQQGSLLWAIVELVTNGSDSIFRRALADKIKQKTLGKISIIYDPEAGRLDIEDNGQGMTIENFIKILIMGSSTNREQNVSDREYGIGRFGQGFYSIFITLYATSGISAYPIVQEVQEGREGKKIKITNLCRELGDPSFIEQQLTFNNKSLLWESKNYLRDQENSITLFSILPTGEKVTIKLTGENREIYFTIITEEEKPITEEEKNIIENEKTWQSADKTFPITRTTIRKEQSSLQSQPSHPFTRITINARVLSNLKNTLKSYLEETLKVMPEAIPIVYREEGFYPREELLNEGKLTPFKGNRELLSIVQEEDKIETTCSLYYREKAAEVAEIHMAMKGRGICKFLNPESKFDCWVNVEGAEGMINIIDPGRVKFNWRDKRLSDSFWETVVLLLEGFDNFDKEETEICAALLTALYPLLEKFNILERIKEELKKLNKTYLFLPVPLASQGLQLKKEGSALKNGNPFYIHSGYFKGMKDFINLELMDRVETRGNFSIVCCEHNQSLLVDLETKNGIIGFVKPEFMLEGREINLALITEFIQEKYGSHFIKPKPEHVLWKTLLSDDSVPKLPASGVVDCEWVKGQAIKLFEKYENYKKQAKQLLNKNNRITPKERRVGGAETSFIMRFALRCYEYYRGIIQISELGESEKERFSKQLAILYAMKDYLLENQQHYAHIAAWSGEKTIASGQRDYVMHMLVEHLDLISTHSHFNILQAKFILIFFELIEHRKISYNHFYELGREMFKEKNFSEADNEISFQNRFFELQNEFSAFGALIKKHHIDRGMEAYFDVYSKGETDKTSYLKYLDICLSTLLENKNNNVENIKELQEVFFDAGGGGFFSSLRELKVLSRRSQESLLKIIACYKDNQFSSGKTSLRCFHVQCIERYAENDDHLDNCYDYIIEKIYPCVSAANVKEAKYYLPIYGGLMGIKYNFQRLGIQLSLHLNSWYEAYIVSENSILLKSQTVGEEGYTLSKIQAAVSKIWEIPVLSISRKGGDILNQARQALQGHNLANTLLVSLFHQHMLGSIETDSLPNPRLDFMENLEKLDLLSNEPAVKNFCGATSEDVVSNIIFQTVDPDRFVVETTQNSADANGKNLDITFKVLTKTLSNGEEENWLALSFKDDGSGISNPESFFVPHLTTKSKEGSVASRKHGHGQGVFTVFTWADVVHVMSRNTEHSVDTHLVMAKNAEGKITFGKLLPNRELDSKKSGTQLTLIRKLNNRAEAERWVVKICAAVYYQLSGVSDIKIKLQGRTVNSVMPPLLKKDYHLPDAKIKVAFVDPAATGEYHHNFRVKELDDAYLALIPKAWRKVLAAVGIKVNINTVETANRGAIQKDFDSIKAIIQKLIFDLAIPYIYGQIQAGNPLLRDIIPQRFFIRFLEQENRIFSELPISIKKEINLELIEQYITGEENEEKGMRKVQYYQNFQSPISSKVLMARIKEQVTLFENRALEKRLKNKAYAMHCLLSVKRDHLPSLLDIKERLSNILVEKNLLELLENHEGFHWEKSYREPIQQAFKQRWPLSNAEEEKIIDNMLNYFFESFSRLVKVSHSYLGEKEKSGGRMTPGQVARFLMACANKLLCMSDDINRQYVDDEFIDYCQQLLQGKPLKNSNETDEALAKVLFGLAMMISTYQNPFFMIKDPDCEKNLLKRLERAMVTQKNATNVLTLWDEMIVQTHQTQFMGFTGSYPNGGSATSQGAIAQQDDIGYTGTNHP